ncbi:MAG: hypothetical protein WEB06_13790 [Actinomycetota bacterium]
MPKPRRKHPGFNSLDLSLQGRQFLRFLESAVGDDIGWRALGSTRERFHVFEVTGDRDPVVLVEAPDRVEEGTIIGRMAFWHDLREMPLVGYVEVVTHRIDPWIWAKETGDRTIVDLPEKARRREADRRSVVIGSARDRITTTLGPTATAPTEVAGLPWVQVMEIVEESMRRSARSKTATDAIACPACGCLCTKNDAATHVCERLEISSN